MRDIRIPADSADFETSVNAVPLPPKSFRVLNSGGTAIFRIEDRAATDGKGAPASYRIYWLPSGLTPTNSTSEADRGAMSKMGVLVGSVPAAKRGDALTLSVPTQNGLTGKYLCVGVNSSGTESSPNHIVHSPWGIA